MLDRKSVSKRRARTQGARAAAETTERETETERDDRAATVSKATVSAGNQSPKKLPTTSVGSGTRPSTRAAALLTAKATGEETAA